MNEYWVMKLNRIFKTKKQGYYFSVCRGLQHECKHKWRKGQRNNKKLRILIWGNFGF